jgi:hypothetical protein
MQNFFSYFYKINLFYMNYKLRFNQTERKETTMGIFFTISMIGLCTAFLVTSGSDLIYRKKQNVNTNTLYLKEHQRLNITDKTLMFSYSTNLPIDIMLNKSIIDIEVGNFRVDRTHHNEEGIYSSIDRVILDWEFCGKNLDFYLSKYNHFANFTEMLNSNGFSNHICIKNMENITIGGQFVSDFFSNIYIKIKKCFPKKGLKCATDAEMEKIFLGNNDVFFNVFIRDAYVDTTNFTNPIIYTIQNYFTSLDYKLKNFIDIYYKESTIISDVGMIFEENKEEKVIHFDSVKASVVSVNKNDGVIMELYINSSDKQTVIVRRYLKIQELAAFIGGILKAYMLFAEIICLYFYQHMEQYEMFSAFFKLNSNDEKNFKVIYNKYLVQRGISSDVSSKLSKNNYFSPDKSVIDQNINQTIPQKSSIHEVSSKRAIKKISQDNSVVNNLASNSDNVNKNKQNVINITNNTSSINKSNVSLSDDSSLKPNEKFSYIKKLELDFCVCSKTLREEKKKLQVYLYELNKRIDFKEIIHSNILVYRMLETLYTSDQQVVMKHDLNYNLDKEINSTSSLSLSDIKYVKNSNIDSAIVKLMDEEGDLNKNILRVVVKDS